MYAAISTQNLNRPSRNVQTFWSSICAVHGVEMASWHRDTSSHILTHKFTIRTKWITVETNSSDTSFRTVTCLTSCCQYDATDITWLQCYMYMPHSVHAWHRVTEDVNQSMHATKRTFTGLIFSLWLSPAVSKSFSLLPSSLSASESWLSCYLANDYSLSPS